MSQPLELIHITLGVPHYFVREDDEHWDDVEKNTTYYCMQLTAGQNFKDWLTQEDNLKFIGVESYSNIRYLEERRGDNSYRIYHTDYAPQKEL